MPQPQQNESHTVSHAHTSHSVATYRRRTVRLLVAHDRLRDVDLWLQELKRVQFAVSAEVVQTPQDICRAAAGLSSMTSSSLRAKFPTGQVRRSWSF